MAKEIQKRIDTLTISEVTLTSTRSGNSVLVNASGPLMIIETMSRTLAIEVHGMALKALYRGGPLLMFKNLKPGDRFTFDTDIARPPYVFTVVEDGTYTSNRTLQMNSDYRISEPHSQEAPVTLVDDD